MTDSRQAHLRRPSRTRDRRSVGLPSRAEPLTSLASIAAVGAGRAALYTASGNRPGSRGGDVHRGALT